MTRCVLFAAAIAIAVQASPRAASGRAMTTDDLITAVRVSDPQLSPDGKMVIFGRTTTDGKSGRRNADIYAVAADGSGTAKPLLGGDKSENTARFSPDGKKIAFLSTRDGATQVYVADADGSNVKKVTDLAMGVQPPLLFSPDGTHVAFVSDVYPDCADEACNKKRSEDAEKNPVKMRRLTRLLYRHWDEWRENVRHHVFVASLDGGAAIDLTPGDYDSPPVQQEDAAIAFSPDGRELAFVSSHEGPDKEAWTTNHDVWVVPVGGGNAKKITANPASDLQPAFSPDGKTLYVRAQRRAGFEADRWYLDAYDRATGAKKTVFTTPDISVGDYTISKDGQTIWFTAGDKGRDSLFTVPAAGGAPKRVVEGAAISAVQPGPGFVVFSKSSLTAPADIYRASNDGADVKALTRENESWLKEVAFSQPESLTVTAPAGDKIQVLADQAAELRPGEEVSGRVPDPRRPAGRVGRRVVVTLEPLALGGAGLGRRRAEPERLDRVRPAVDRPHHRRLGWPRDGRAERRVRCRGENAVQRLAAHGHRRGELRRLRGELDPRPLDPLQGRRHP